MYEGTLSLFLLSAVHTQMCTQLVCTRTSALMNSTIPSTRNPPYVCRGMTAEFFCQVENGASLQWASEPQICSTVPISYTPFDSEGDIRERDAYQSNLTSIIRNPPFSNFTSSLLLNTTESMDSVMVQCGDQLSSCTSTQTQSTFNVTGKYMM